MIDLTKKMQSKNYFAWYSVKDARRCRQCGDLHGKVYQIGTMPSELPPMHDRCRCWNEALEARIAGTATEQDILGADWWLKRFQRLPDYYITEKQAKAQGWKPIFGNLSTIAPGKMLTKGIYQNRNGHLPSAPGRIWYEADINYTGGWRGDDRILFSNDGLIFVSYDHYETFVEIV